VPLRVVLYTVYRLKKIKNSITTLLFDLSFNEFTQCEVNFRAVDPIQLFKGHFEALIIGNMRPFLVIIPPF